MNGRLWAAALPLLAVFLSVAMPTSAQAQKDPQAAVVRAQSFLVQGRYRTAAGWAQFAVRADPKNALARLVHARALLELGEGDEAQAALDRAAALGASRTFLTPMLAHILLIKNDAAGALKLLSGQGPPRQQAEYAARLRAIAHHRLGNHSAFRGVIAEAQAQLWATPDFWTTIGRLFLQSGDIVPAFGAAERALVRGQSFSPALLLQGELARRRYGLTASLPWLRRAAAADPGSIAALVELASTLGDMGANREMLATTRQLQALDPGNAWAFYFQAVMAARAGQSGLARTLIDQMGDRLSSVPGVMLLRGVLDLQQNAPQRATRTLTRLLENQPGNLTARRLLALAAWRSGDAKAALFHLAPLVARPDADAYGLTLAARLMEVSDNRAGAILLLTRASQPQRVMAQPLVIAGYIGTNDHERAARRIAQALVAGQARAAFDLAQAARRAFPDQASSHQMFGDVVAANGQWAAAAQAYKDAANIEFSQATALRLSKALLASGQSQAALDVLALYLSQNPQSIPVRLAAADADMAVGRWRSALLHLGILRARLGDRNAAVLDALSLASLRSGNPDHALLYARMSWSLMPQSSALRARLAQATAAKSRRL